MELEGLSGLDIDINFDKEDNIFVATCLSPPFAGISIHAETAAQALEELSLVLKFYMEDN